LKVDVLVVGAGPAGSCTSREIAEAGFSVVTIDRRKELGYPVQCGEFLPTVEELRRILPNSETYGDLFEIEASMIERETKYIDLFGPAGINFKMKFSGRTLNRREFDKSLWRRAEKAGAKLLTETEFEGLKNQNCANTSKGDIEFSYLVGADGPLSRVRKLAKLKEPNSISIAISGQAKGDLGDSVKMYFGTIAPGGYAWIIPKKNGANVGLGIQKKFCNEKLSDLFKKFAEGFEINATDVAYGQVPISGPIDRTVSGNCLVVGDAAGQVMATNGGGIPIAMICGRIAGRCISTALKGSGKLTSYEEEWRRQIQAPLSNSARTKAMADIFFKNDSRLKFAMKVLGLRGLERAILCKRIFYLF